MKKILTISNTILDEKFKNMKMKKYMKNILNLDASEFQWHNILIINLLNQIFSIEKKILRFIILIYN